MNFFINSSFNEKNSGIEHAQLKRAELFRDNNEPFKLVFREWNPRLHFWLNKVGVSPSETLAMFDYFQKTEQVEDKIVRVVDLDFSYPNVIYSKNEQEKLYQVLRKVGERDVFLARVRWFTEDEHERVSMVEKFDGFGNLYRVDHYDFRGFMTLSQFYTPDNKIGSEIWWDIDGKPVLETYNRFYNNGKYDKAGWRLIEDQAVYTFSTIEELTLHFLNRINADYWDDKKLSVFVLDRSHLADWAVTVMERPIYSVYHLHNSHAGDAQDTMHSVMNNFYEYGLTNANRYDAIVSATEKQTQDVKARFAPQTKMFTIPVGVIPNAVFEEERLPMSARKQHSVLVTARVAPEKRIGEIAMAVGIAKKEIPDINLTIYGYVDHRDNDIAMKKINEAIEKYGLKDAIEQHDYTANPGDVQANHQIYALASIMEGFNLSMMEAYSHGMVGVTWDVNYGPNELTVDGENGYIIPYGKNTAEIEPLIEKMAAYFVELFKDADKLQAMSDKSYELSERYSEKNVWKAWRQLLDDAKKKAIHYTPDVTEGLGNQMPQK
ncbi:MAG: glycosyltransferase [Streptococcaceae bacterium]|jgi:poly(glycerol-phosphate) alpha-glucosyltransferase|nr:glycosyltransferase [Streptococcaceae bacterium]